MAVCIDPVPPEHHPTARGPSGRPPFLRIRGSDRVRRRGQRPPSTRMTRRFFRRLTALVVAIGTGTLVRATPVLTSHEFAEASRPEGATLFTTLPATQTGLVVDNSYDDPQMWSGRYRAFMGGAMGSGVAAGDFDGDGNVDLYVSTKTKPGRLFRNLGHWKFQDVTDAAGLAENGSWLSWVKDTVSSDKAIIWRQGAVFVDVNNDGRPDLFVCRNGAPNLLYINQGDGTFKEEAGPRGLGIADGSVIGAFADYDRDGWIDVLIVTNQVDGTEPSGRADRLFHNTGDGHFVEVTERAGLTGRTFGHTATWLDYDGDGWPDFYIDNDFSGPDHLYRNNHDGTFTEVLDAAVPHTPYSSMGADTADVDNDGHPDLFIADMATTTREKDRRGLAASREDMLMTGTKDGVAPQYMRNALLLNTGRGVFREAACWAGIAATDWTWSVRFEDFDNDGWQDLFVTNGMVREANNSDVLNAMMRALSDLQRISVMKRSPLLAEPNLAYRNLHGTGFEPVTDQWGLGEVGVSFGTATADFDNDGDLDLVYLNYDGGLSVLRNDTTGRHRIQVRLRATRSNRSAIGAVVRLESHSGPQSRTFTAARGYASGSELVAHFGLGNDTKVDRLVVEWPSGVRQEFSDLAADRAYVIEERGDAAPPVASADAALFQPGPEIGLSFRDQSPLTIPDREQAFIPFRTDRSGPGVAVGDVDGDGHDDLWIGATPGSPARLLRWRDGRYVAETPSGLPPAGAVEDGPPLLLDVDGDGTRDLLVTKAGADANVWPDGFHPKLYLNDGRANFRASAGLPDVAVNTGAACAADIDGDGDLDVFLGARSIPGRYPETPQSVLLRHEGGGFVDASAGLPHAGALGLVKSALFRDVDGDGRPDLLVALEWDYVRYLHNDGDGHFSDRTEQAGFTSGGRGWWNSLASADFNGDGRPDFAAGNLGLNTTYRATPERPATLFYGDFAQNGTRLLAEATYDGDTLYPVRARADLGARLPAILRKFPKNDAFARATMAEVFGEKPLAAATAFHAGNFSSGVFLSQPDGTYRFVPFPRVAQIGPMLGLVAADLDGDGRADLCAVQNTDAAVPRFDGGVGIFLRGLGDGTFEAIAPERSGLVVPGNGRALTLLDPSDAARPDLFLTRQGGASLHLVNRPPSARWLKLTLHGRAANPDAIGASVEVKFSSGRTTHFQTGLGGGWFTQSAPDLFVATPAGENVVEAVVRWPDGGTSRHPAPREAGIWSLREPERR